MRMLLSVCNLTSLWFHPHQVTLVYMCWCMCLLCLQLASFSLCVSILVAEEVSPPPQVEKPSSAIISSPIRLSPEPDRPTSHHRRVISPNEASRLHVKERLYLSKGDIGT